ncbi:hypothetical protein GCM10010365_07150 [Streptomyces poonensis]|uniref:Uncharacterized protein n=1 Tax=Streptomyces poonensis TaxID=68255 RepID=A0A918P8U6_9ACTN|nr:hypothetical protein GCM10010365_07150 [Streptomyces poonensis]GLJ87848.1 hypothetical protein GCM10017589_04480 [Streptomyces poonensis]
MGSRGRQPENAPGTHGIPARCYVRAAVTFAGLASRIRQNSATGTWHRYMLGRGVSPTRGWGRKARPARAQRSSVAGLPPFASYPATASARYIA